MPFNSRQASFAKRRSIEHVDHFVLKAKGIEENDERATGHASALGILYESRYGALSIPL